MIARSWPNPDLKASKTPGPAHSYVQSALRTLEAGAGGINAVAAAIHNGLGAPFIAAVDLIRAPRAGSSSPAWANPATWPARSRRPWPRPARPPSSCIPGEASHGDLGMITPDDVIMALSWSGETSELKDLIDYSRRFRIGLVAVTADRDSTLGKAADVALVLPQAREACPHNLAPTTSSLMQLALGDALAIALLESRSFTAVDFGLLHPGGRLGTLLKFTRDLMHSGEFPAAGSARHQDVESRCLTCRKRGSAASASPIAAAIWSASSPTATSAATCAAICSTPASTRS